MAGMTLTHLLAFAGIVLLAAMAPGPDFAIVIRQSVVSGVRSGMAAALGVGAGVFVWAVSAAVGVAALLAASATAFTVVKVVGAAYLLYLGIRALRAATRRDDETDAGSTERADATVWTSFRQGLITNVLNPKAAAFFVALMPQFVGGDSAYGATLLLAGIAGATAIAWFCVLANLVGAVRRLLTRPAVRRAIDAVTGTALVALGIRLAATSRP
jgi:RhtB (resistance to homoserine/threonine) family protein